MSKTIQVYTNAAGGQGTVQITMKGECWLPVQVTPPSANFGRVTRDQVEQGSTQKLTIVNNVEEAGELTDVRSTNPLFKVDLKPLEPGKKWEVSVSLVPTPESPLRKGPVSGTIEMTTSVADTPTLQIPISAVIPADVDVQPENVQLLATRTEDTPRAFTINNYTKSTLQISDLTATSPELKPTLQELQPGKTYRIDLKIPATYKVAPGGDKITFKTTCPTMPEISIPITELKTAQPSISSVNPAAAMPNMRPAATVGPAAPAPIGPPAPATVSPVAPPQPSGGVPPPGTATRPPSAPGAAAPGAPRFEQQAPPAPEQPKPSPPPVSGR